jgi:hypothetical protein
MPNRTLALALVGLTVAPCARAEDVKWPSSNLEQRAAERGPIRTQVEAALAAPAIPWGVWVLVGLLSLYAMLLEWGRGWSNI